MSKDARTVTLEVVQSPEGFLGVSLMRLVGNHSGDGYRITGPKRIGTCEMLKSVALTESGIDRLIEELQKSKKFLQEAPSPALKVRAATQMPDNVVAFVDPHGKVQGAITNLDNDPKEPA